MSANNNNNSSSSISNNNNSHGNNGSNSGGLGHSSIGCTSFRPHLVKPDKCRNCFGDKSKHQLGTEVTGDSSRQSDKLEEQENVGEPTSSIASSTATTAAEADQERTKLVERYEKEIDKLKEDLRLAGRQPCEQCQSYRGQLEASRSECRKLEGERDQLRKELEAMEREMEEMHDTFKEEESEQFEQTKQELDLAMKNCKILQIRLHKAERQYGQLEQVKTMLEQQLEESNNRLQQEQQQPPSQQQQQQQHQVNFTQIGNDAVKLSTIEYDKLLKDLSDTFEREKDLQEQIKYSQEEAQLKSDRLQSVEAENEILLSKVSKLTLANSRLRAQAAFSRQVSSSELSSSSELPPTAAAPTAAMSTVSDIREATQERSELIQESEQLKLALEFAQAECERLKGALQESQAKLDSVKNALQASESGRSELEAELNRLRLRRQTSFEASAGGGGGGCEPANQVAKLELECRQLRSKLVQSERENRQLKAARQSASSFMPARAYSVPKSHSMDTPTPPTPPPPSQASGAEQARYRELNRQLREQCDSLREQNRRLEQRLEDLAGPSDGLEGGRSTGAECGPSKMESDLVEKLKRRLDFSESELAKARSRLVEMDLECGRVQRQHKRLVESLERSADLASGGLRRKVQLPAESARDSMSRQELRQAVRELDQELDECFALLRAKECLITERAGEQQQQQASSPGSTLAAEEQVKSLRRLLEQERLLSNNLKIDVSSLEEAKQELLTNTMMLERERVVMEEELDKLRSLNLELNTEQDELRRTTRSQANRLKDLQAAYEKVRADLLKGQQRQKRETESASPTSTAGADQSPNDRLLMARDLSELKVKNGFLMRQLEIAREEQTRQTEDLKQAHEIQQRRLVEMAQIELRERHLAESQQLRDELNELKQRLATCQRQVGRHEEEAAGERERLRGLERDWRRERGQLQQKIEQLEAQLSLERRSSEFRAKEMESVVRDKERELIGWQDKCVQLERDLKRSQNKYSLLEENSESKLSALAKELEAKRRELNELIATNSAREEQFFEHTKRFNSEKSTLGEALESLRRSYDEKLAELKSSRELLSLRQEQAYKERLAAQERLDELAGQLLRLAEHQTQARLLEQQLQAQERQADSLRRDCMQLKEDRGRLKARCDELEGRCAHYEKQELISKTSSISSAGLFSRAKSSLSSPSAKEPAQSAGRKCTPRAVAQRPASNQDEADREQQQQQQATRMVERLTGKINDQRHLINMLKEQYDSAQVELKQIKLVQSAEKQKWQSLVSQLQSRLNESEERLLFETSLTSQATFESCRRKFEVKWAEERRSSLSMIQQQQQQNELLMKDLKKLSQQHELLRLHSKQLEANNQKLSSKLIEYQNQQQQQQPFRQAAGPKATDASPRELRDCLAANEDLLRQQAELEQLNSRLLGLLSDQVRPLVATVNKIMAAIEPAPSDKHPEAPAPPAGDGGRRALPDNSSGFGSSRHGSADDEGSKSTLRPLLTSRSPHQSDSDSMRPEAGGCIPTSPPAQLQQTPSRLSRLFSSKSPSPAPAESRPAKVVKKVRVKSAALGITPSEKRLLRERLAELSAAIDELSLASSKSKSKSRPKSGPTTRRPASGQAGRHDHSSGESSLVAAPTPTGTTTTTVTTTNTTAQGRVRWQMDESDLESERSWSLQSDTNRAPISNSANLYRRFPQTSPSASSNQPHPHPLAHRQQPAASLTDYESESSFAGSECSLARGPRLVSGVESDSCMATSGSSAAGSSARRRGLKVRLTDTLRNISRSITGLASDSESESQLASGSARLRRKVDSAKKHPATKGPATKAQQTPAASAQDENIKEIRV